MQADKREVCLGPAVQFSGPPCSGQEIPTESQEGIQSRSRSRGSDGPVGVRPPIDRRLSQMGVGRASRAGDVPYQGHVWAFTDERWAF